MKPALVQAEEAKNKKLLFEAEDYKSSEIAKEVTRLYDKRYREIDTVFEQLQYKNIANKDLPNIFFFLYARSHIDTAMRHLLDLCFLEVAKQNIHSMEKSEQIAAKI